MQGIAVEPQISMKSVGHSTQVEETGGRPRLRCLSFLSWRLRGRN